MGRTQVQTSLIVGSMLSLCLAGSAWAATASFTGTYTGQGSNATTCNTSFKISGQEPTDGNRHPVFLYMDGTTETFTDAAASAAVAGMANRGFVAATIQYDSGSFGNCSQIGGKAQCIFNPNSNPSAVSVLCARATADCSKGIVVAGFSQGAVIATLAKNTDSRVQAAYGLGDGVKYSSFDLSACMANGKRSLLSDRLRAVDGDKDQFTGNSQSAQQTNMQSLTGFTCPSGSFVCLQSNGSGWIIVQDNQVKDGSADHCYMRASGGCFGSQNSLDSGWQSGTTNWELNPNLDWLAGFATP